MKNYVDKEEIKKSIINQFKAIHQNNSQNKDMKKMVEGFKEFAQKEIDRLSEKLKL